jgi:uncharacterized membrane protein YphA (DoxX/SURF4 family)
MSGVSILRTEWEPRVLSVLRIVAGVLYLQHGLNKMFNFPPLATHVPYGEHVFSLVPGAAGLIEVFGSLLLILGLFTRPVAFIMSGEMAIRLFLRASAAELLSNAQHGRLGNPVLLRLPLPVRRRRWLLEPRPTDVARQAKLTAGAVSEASRC